MGAVLFTLLLLSANTMAQGFRERIRELAVLKTLGFDNVRVSVRLLAESAIVCRVGGSSACWPRGRGERLYCSIGGTTSASPNAQPGAQVWFAGLGWMLLVALAVGLPSARCAQRLPGVGALAAVPSLGAVRPGTKTGHE